MKKKLIFSGVATALVTPFFNGNIDYGSLDRIIEAQINGGVSALVVGGTTGEVATLDDTERYELYSYACRRVHGRVKTVMGAGTNDTKKVIEHIRCAERAGADALLIVTPYYNKGTYRGVTEHYKRIAGETDLPIILYNVPSRTGVNLTVRQLEELAKIDNVVGIKEASDSVDRLTELSKFGDDLYLYAGNDTQILATLALGGEGVISVISNLYPAYTARLCREYFDGHIERAQTLQQNIFDLARAMFTETNPTPIKYAMSLAGLCSAEMRLPLYEAEDSTKESIRRELSLFGEAE